MGHNKVMKKVNVSTFKAKISSYLRSVRKGNRYLILERNVPVAIVSPNESVELEIGEPKTSFLAVVEKVLKGASFEQQPKSLSALRADRERR